MHKIHLYIEKIDFLILKNSEILKEMVDYKILNTNFSQMDILYLDFLVRQEVEDYISFKEYIVKFIVYHIIFTMENQRTSIHIMVQENCSKFIDKFRGLISFLYFIIDAYEAWEIYRISYIKTVYKKYKENVLFDRLLAGKLIENIKFKNYINSITDLNIPDFPIEYTTKSDRIIFVFLYKIREFTDEYPIIYRDYMHQLFVQFYYDTYRLTYMLLDSDKLYNL